MRGLGANLPVSTTIRMRGRVELLYDQAGMGDTLMVGAVARELKNRLGNTHVTVHRVIEDLLEGNPYVDDIGTAYRGIDLNYHQSPHIMRRDGSLTLIETMCRKVGIRSAENRLDMYLTKEERKNAYQALSTFPRPVITIQTTAGAYGAARKHWPHKHWKQLVSLLRQHLGATVIHLGGSGERAVDGAVNFLGSRAIRDSIAVLEQADLHIGIVSSLMHAADAVGTESVILYGGFEPYELHAYETVYPISSSPPCAPCITVRGRVAPCPNNSLCMTTISPDIVHKAAENLLRRTVGGSNSPNWATEPPPQHRTERDINSQDKGFGRRLYTDRIHTG